MGLPLETPPKTGEEVMPGKGIIVVSQSDWEVGLSEDYDLKGGILGG